MLHLQIFPEISITPVKMAFPDIFKMVVFFTYFVSATILHKPNYISDKLYSQFFFFFQKTMDIVYIQSLNLDVLA